MEDLKIVDLDLKSTRPSPTAPGMKLMYLKLSHTPDPIWIQAFNKQREFPRHTMWRRAQILCNYIVVDCPPEEIEKYHLEDLKTDVMNANSASKAYSLKLKQQQEAEAKKMNEEKQSLEQIKSRLKFD